MQRLKTPVLMKRNIKALLKHRGRTQGELARFLKYRDKDDKNIDSWMSHVLDEDDAKRELPMELWDRAAEFLGVDTYHFFIPGIAQNMDTERRGLADRRSWKERRKGSSLPARPQELDAMNVLRALPLSELEELLRAALKRLDLALRGRRAIPGLTGGQGMTAETDEPTRAPTRVRKRRDEPGR